MLTSMQGRSGSPSMNGVSAPAGSLSSPQMTNHSQPQRLSSGVIPTINHIQNSVKNRNPQASPEMIERLTTETLDHHYRLTQSSVTAAAAMQAAAGPNLSTLQNNMNINLLSPPIQQQQQQQPPPIMNGLSNTSVLSREHYAQLLRSQQSQQRATTMNGVRTVSRSATPQTHPQTHHRSGSNQGGPPPSRSPRPGQAQMAGGQWNFWRLFSRGLAGWFLLFLTFLVYIMSRADSLLWTERWKRIGIGISPFRSILHLLEAYRFFCTYGSRQFCVHHTAQWHRERKTHFTRRGLSFVGSQAGIGMLVIVLCGVLYLFFCMRKRGA